MSTCSKSPPGLRNMRRTRTCSMAAMPDDSSTNAYVGKYQDLVRSRPLRATAENPGDANGEVSNVFSIAKTAPRPLGQGRRWFSGLRAGSRSSNRLYVPVQSFLPRSKRDEQKDGK
jgi:hypothetical protein